jgi:hypothetical protein
MEAEEFGLLEDVNHGASERAIPTLKTTEGPGI